MRLIRPFLKSILFVGITTWLAACGGSGGGVGDPTYIGNTSSAVITTTNATRLVALALGDTTSTSDSLRGGQTGPAHRLEQQLLDTLTQNIEVRSSELRSTVGIVIDEYVYCDSGRVHWTGKLDDYTGLGTLTASFENCRYGDETLNGKATYKYTASDLTYYVYTDITIDFSSLKLTTSTFDVSFDGSIRQQLFIGASTVRATYNVVTSDNVSDYMTMSENIVVDDVFNDIFYPTSVSETITGRVFDSVHGFVDVTTPVQAFFSSLSQSFPDSGELLLTGSGNASIRVTVLSKTDVMLDLDLDGDGIFEITLTMTWLELFAA